MLRIRLSVYFRGGTVQLTASLERALEYSTNYSKQPLLMDYRIKCSWEDTIEECLKHGF